MAIPKQAQQYFGALSDYKLRKVYDILSEHIDPVSDLNFADHYQLLVAVVLSAQATDKSVNAACIPLFAQYSTPKSIAALGVEGLIPFIRKIGLYRNKAKNVIQLSKDLIEKHNSTVPNTRTELEALPGVGRKTASVILNIAFGQPTIAVDTHVHRTSQRLDIADCTTVEQTEAVLIARTPKKHALHAHHYLILHGRYCCTARKPACERCPIIRYCPSADKQL